MSFISLSVLSNSKIPPNPMALPNPDKMLTPTINIMGGLPTPVPMWIMGHPTYNITRFINEYLDQNFISVHSSFGYIKICHAYLYGTPELYVILTTNLFISNFLSMSQWCISTVNWKYTKLVNSHPPWAKCTGILLLWPKINPWMFCPDKSKTNHLWCSL